MALHNPGHTAGEDVSSDIPTTICCLSYSAATATLAAGTPTGRVALWRTSQVDPSDALTQTSPMQYLDIDPSMQWVRQRCLKVSGRVDRVLWTRDSRFSSTQTIMSAGDAA